MFTEPFCVPGIAGGPSSELPCPGGETTGQAQVDAMVSGMKRAMLEMTRARMTDFWELLA